MTKQDGIKLVSSDLDRSAGIPEAVPEVVTSLHGFGGSLFAELPATGNLAISPYSVAVALGMTLNGAGGPTAEEMKKVLGATDVARYNGGLNALTTQVEALAGTVKGPDGKDAEIALDAANALFGEATTKWSDPFLDVLAEEYGAGMQTVDYINAYEQARGLINEWVAGKTHDKIPELLAEGILTTLTRLVLVNALYLKAPWLKPFEKTLTKNAPFHLRDGKSVNVELMQANLSTAAAAKGPGWQAVRVPYVGEKLAMTIVLPDEGKLDSVQTYVGSGGLGDVLTAAQPAAVDLQLPKWTFRTQASLADTLKALGMPTAFDKPGGFAAMTAKDDDTGKDLVIADVVHEVFVAVDEKGTEAAAATAVVMERTSAPAAGVKLVVDRPFLFAIHDVEHGTPLFLGRVDDPTVA
ncbi:serpin family protein [Nocardioides speluncae]|uniref:serpin family protein n=1 Tax=Nocardioides speluncae TaxID=2670337 RepID=UPI001379A143|nr:serpin family protein [Nocardioides speluncae]